MVVKVRLFFHISLDIRDYEERNLNMDYNYVWLI